MVLCQIPTISPSNPGVGEWGIPLIGALSACAYCKISKKVCAKILDALKYQLYHNIALWYSYSYYRYPGPVVKLRHHTVTCVMNVCTLTIDSIIEC